MQLRRRTVARINLLLFFVIAYALVGVVWEYVESGGDRTLAGPIIGFLIGAALGLLEMSRFATSTRARSFSMAVLLKSLIYVAVIAIPWMIISFFGGLAQGFGIPEYIDWMFSMEFFWDVVIIFMIHLVVVFLRQLNRLLGPGKLLRYVSGRYHSPRVENRVFMFLDLTSSTTLAETLEGEQYFSFLNSFFRDISEPIMERGAEIYQYIGDEIVLTWPLKSGLRDANCVRVFVEILAEIHTRKEQYLADYGHVPEFKAGLHFGDVITAEIGDIKKEIVYNGDVLNTTARIQSKCNELGHRLIASQGLVDILDLPEFTEKKPLGEVELRGKAEPMALVGLM